MKHFFINTKEHNETIDITSKVQELIDIKEGICLIHVMHTSAGISINESDGMLNKDIQKALTQAIPTHAGYLHDSTDNNAEAHIKATIVGQSLTVPISEGKLVLGTWQNILLLEFDGPRKRKIVIKTISQ